MPRLARMYIESQYLHIIVQGINKEYIFKGIEAKERYKATLKKNLLDTKVKVKDKKVEISFNNVNDLNRILEILNVKE